MFNITMGTVDSFVKRMQLQQKWTLKKSQAAFLMQKPETLSPLEQEQKSKKIDAITTKLKSGKKLSASEMEYLRANAPGLYAKAVKVKLEREGFERKLKRCKTKDEVNRLIMQKTDSILSEISKIDSGGMDDAGKMAAYDFVAMRMSAVEDAYKTFIAKGGYHRLPKNEEEHRQENGPEKTEAGTAEQAQAEEAAKAAQDPENAGDAIQDSPDPSAGADARPETGTPPDTDTAPVPAQTEPAPAPPPEAPSASVAADSAKRGFTARA